MSGLFLFLSMLSFFALIIGLISPKIVKMNSRKQVVIVTFSSMLIFTILSGATADTEHAGEKTSEQSQVVQDKDKVTEPDVVVTNKRDEPAEEDPSLEEPIIEQTDVQEAEPVDAEAEEEKVEEPAETLSQKNAVSMAEGYLMFTAFSKSGLVNQLKFEGFDEADANYAVNKLNIDWKEQAVTTAEDYLSYTSFSKSGLIDQLKFEGFDEADANYAVNELNIDWKEQAVIKAEDYLNFTSFSRSGLIDQLKFEGFSDEEATYAVDQIGF